MKLELSRLNYPCREESLLNITNVIFSEENDNRLLEFELVVGEKELLAAQILITSFNKEEEQIKESKVEATNALTPQKRIKYTLKLDKNAEFGQIIVSKLITKEFESFENYFAISYATKERISLIVEGYLSGGVAQNYKATNKKSKVEQKKIGEPSKAIKKEKEKRVPRKVTDPSEYAKKKKVLVVLLIISGVLVVSFFTFLIIYGFVGFPGWGENYG